jgi:hypothetical protein
VILTYCQVEGYIKDYVAACASRDYTHTDQAGNLVKDEDVEFRQLSGASLIGYFGKIVHYINEKIVSKHSVHHRNIFQDDYGEYSYTQIIEYIKKTCSRTNREGINSNANLDCTKIPLGRETTDDYPFMEYAGQFDLVHVNSGMYKRGEYWQMLSSAMNYSSCGRGGEPSYVSYHKMMWNQVHQCIVATWFQSKTLFGNPTTWVTDRKHPEICVMFCFGLVWISEVVCTDPLPMTGMIDTRRLKLCLCFLKRREQQLS